MVREPHPGEAAAIADLLNANARALQGEAALTTATIEDWFGFDDVQMRVVEEDGALVAYGDVGHSPDGSKAYFDVREHPDLPGAAEELWPVLEELAGDAVRRAVVDMADTSLQAQLERRGYRTIRSSFRMRVDLDGVPPAPEPPAGIEIRTLRPGEEERAYDAHMASFADHWGFEREPFPRWRQWMVDANGHDPSLWFLAEDAGELVGISLCRMQESGDPEHGWVGILGVVPSHRGRGLGETLLRHSFHALGRRGCTRVSLGVDAENTTGAVRLYERAGMRQVHRSDTWEQQP